MSRQPAILTEDASIYLGDCLDVLAEIPDNSIDAIVTDPPYGLGFMGKAWDDLPPGLPWAEECLRVLKPGGHLLAFGGTRTWHRLAVAVEDAGFEVRDSIAWLYGSGFPKSLDVSKAIDKSAGATREVVGERSYGDGHVQRSKAPRFNGNAYANGELYVEAEVRPLTAPATPAAQQWSGWGTALKPAFEPIVVARKPLVGTVAANVLAHGTGALNIDATRIAHDEPAGNPHVGNGGARSGGIMGAQGAERVRETTAASTDGRWPANVLLDGSQADALDEQSGVLTSGKMLPTHTTAEREVFGQNAAGGYTTMETYGDSGGASRFFPTFRYQAKAPTRERPTVVAEDGTKTAHPTVKPLALMRWLVRLVTPPGGTVLDTFAGSGATIEAAGLEGFRSIGIEREASYLPLIQVRLDRLPRSTM